MTASHVDGVAVITDQPTPAPIKTHDGKPILWTQTRTLLLDDGRVVYGCVHCDFVRDTAAAIRPHLRVHAERPKPAVKPTKDAKSMTLDDLLARVGDLQKVEADRDRWKARAVKAERALETLRRALNG